MSAPKQSDKLFVEFSGYGLMRVPTDPDPTDDPRGVSGYTFAFGDEPNLDRAIYLQPHPEIIRTHSPKLGVFVTHAERRFAAQGKDPLVLDGLKGASMNWEDFPKLENRNLILTEAGKEPIIPFNMRIQNEEVDIYRTVPINSEQPKQPVYKADAAHLAAMAAYGMYPEPDTIGRATGMWDPYKRVLERIALLEEDLKNTPDTPENAGKITVIRGRLKQLYIGRDDPTDRRVSHSTMVERFSFPMDGGTCEITGPGAEKALGGELDTAIYGPKVDGGHLPTGWQISFWIGAWDSDLLCAYFEGTLQAPYKS